MAELTDQQIETALNAGKALANRDPRAVQARLDRSSGQIIVTLSNGCSFSFPPHLAQGLETATEEQLANIDVLGAGYGLHWDDLDVDLSVPHLMAGLFGTRSFMARQAGQSSSPAKAAAARSNGTKGGRPRKVASLA